MARLTQPFIMIRLQMDGAHTIIACAILAGILFITWYAGWCCRRWYTNRKIRRKIK